MGFDCLKLLLVTESEECRALVHEQLLRAEGDWQESVVHRGDDFVAALDKEDWDTILYQFDFNNSDLSQALTLVQSKAPETPCVVYSENAPEEVLIESMSFGASDYLDKRSPKRLLPILRRNVVVREMKKQIRALQEKIERQEEQIRMMQRHVDVSSSAHRLMHDFNNDLATIDFQLEELFVAFDKTKNFAALGGSLTKGLRLIQKSTQKMTRASQEFQKVLPTLSDKEQTAFETIMVIEDEKTLKGLIATALRNEGYRVITASSAEEALRRIQTSSEPIHLLITDIVLPQMNGVELARQVHELNPKVKIIFQSGYSDYDLSKSGLKRDEIFFIEKPFGQKALLLMVRSVLEGQPQSIS